MRVRSPALLPRPATPAACARFECRVYETLLERYDVEPQHAVFIDDSMANVKGAEAVGLNGIHFLSPEQLRASLIGLGIRGLEINDK